MAHTHLGGTRELSRALWARLKPIVVPPDVDRTDDDPTRPAPQKKRPPVH